MLRQINGWNLLKAKSKLKKGTNLLIPMPHETEESMRREVEEEKKLSKIARRVLMGVEGKDGGKGQGGQEGGEGEVGGREGGRRATRQKDNASKQAGNKAGNRTGKHASKHKTASNMPSNAHDLPTTRVRGREG